MLRAIKIRIYPNKQQEEFLMKSFGCSRFVYNYFLALRNTLYQDSKKSLSCFDMVNKLPELKQEYPWLKEVSSQSLQQVLGNLDNAYTAFFKHKSDYPKFKSKNKKDFSFSLPQGVYLSKNRLVIPKVKEGIKFKDSRIIDGTIKTTTISKNPSGQYFASLLVENGKELPQKDKFSSETTIGIDLGIIDYAVISDGTRIKNPKYLKQSKDKLKKEQQKLAKKQKGSKNRNKQRLKVAKTHQKITNQRNDFLHKLTFELTHKNQVGTICIEDLSVNSMLKDKKLSRVVQDASWATFKAYLEYKCDWYGKNLIVIDRYAPSSKMCPECGRINNKLTLSNRTWVCECGKIWDRDLLAAQNIRRFGIEQQLRRG